MNSSAQSADDASTGGLPKSTRYVLGGLGLVGVAAILPIITADAAVIEVNGERQTSMSGHNAPDWWLMFGMAVVSALLVYFRSWSRLTVGVVGLAGALITTLALTYINDPTWGADVVGSPSASPGFGLYAIGAGGVALLAGAYRGNQQRKRRATEPTREAGDDQLEHTEPTSDSGGELEKKRVEGGPTEADETAAPAEDLVSEGEE